MMIFLHSITFFSALLCTVQHTEAEASSSSSSRTSKFRVPPITTTLPPRGGGGSSSESASSWNAGSRFNDHRTISPQHQQSKGYQSTTTTPATYYNKQEETVVKEVFARAFQIREDRNRFIMRVYAILSCQLLFTAGTIHAFHLYPTIQEYMLYNPLGRKVPLIGLLISSIAWMITLSSDHIRQSSLMRWPLLLAFTVGESIAVGFISSVYAYGTVMKAMITTGMATLGVTLYTIIQKNPKYDLSQWGRALSGIGLAFLLLGLLHILELFGVIPIGLLPYSETLYSIVGAGLFSLYLAHHTRLIVSGTSAKYQMNEKDYILGAMSVYSDIINIFLYILRVLGEDGNRGKRGGRR